MDGTEISTSFERYDFDNLVKWVAESFRVAVEDPILPGRRGRSPGPVRMRYPLA
jgi:hypothetical protein